MTIYEVLGKGEIVVIADSQSEYLASWNTRNIIRLWIETEGRFELIETRTFPEDLPNIQMAIAAATRVVLNIADEARILLHNIQPWPHYRG